MPKKQVVFVVETWLGRKGGAERVIADVANGLAERGHEVTLIHFDMQQAEHPYPLHAAILTRNLAPQTKVAWLMRKARGAWRRISSKRPESAWKMRYGRFAKAIKTYMDQHPADALVAVMPPAIAAVEMAGIDPHVRTLASVHSSPYNEYQDPARWGMGVYGTQRRLKAIESFDHVGVLLPEFKNWHTPKIQEKMSVMPNMIKQTLQAERADASESKTILAVGRAIPCKQQHLLIEAWTRLHPNHPDWSLEIYGDGPLSHQLKEQADKGGLRHQDIFKGTVSDMAAVYKKGAFLVHPSSQEGMPLVVGEALAAGLPVIGFQDCPGVNTFIQDGYNGVLVDGQEQPAANLETAIRNMMTHHEVRAAMGRRAPESIQRFSPESVLDIWERDLGLSERH